MLRMNKLAFKLRLIWEIRLKTLIIIIIASAAQHKVRNPCFFLLLAVFNLNLPLPRGTGYATWRAALDTALQAVADFGAQALVVPLGLDTFAGDPISGFTLQTGDYLAIGQALASAGLPTVFTFEGGYAVAEVGVNAVNVLQGFDQGK